MIGSSKTRPAHFVRLATFAAASLLLAATIVSGKAVADSDPASTSAGKTGVRTGGLVIPGKPSVSDAVCVRQCVSQRRATPGATVKVVGKNLDRVRRVVFPGRGGPIRVRYEKRAYGAVRAIVPKAAVDGRPFVLGAGSRSNRSPRQLEILPVSKIPKEVFPVRGPHNFGSSGARFGAARSGYSHQGQDVMASCGTRLVSIRRAKVLVKKYHSAAGHYVVLRNLGTNTEFAYMHLRRPSKLRPGQVVGAGQLIGFVGQTGRAYGCHLHFEYWVGKWQSGGRPIDPLSYLRSL